MKKYFIMLVLVLALGGGGYFAWTEYFAGTSAGIVLPSLLSRDDKPLYIEIERLTAPFIRDQRFVQYVVLDVSLEVVEELDADKVRQLTHGCAMPSSESCTGWRRFGRPVKS